MQVKAGPVSSDWLSNYRRNFERILRGEGFNRIDFLPEPFAVFQYYRYGLRHPLLVERKKQHALVVDFGGGTFDVCIIETTKEGDISQTGRNSKPLAASSEPVGGFFINRMIVEELFYKHLPPKRAEVKKGLEVYKKWQEGQDLSTSADKYKNFVTNFHEVAYGATEDLKLALCKHVTNWRLEAAINLTAPVTLPEDPFSTDSRPVNVQFSANELRSLFISKVWEQRLKPVIRRTFQRGMEELSGAPISVVLLSGGSVNIGWLTELLQRDFANELNDAEILRLPDFQEVVAKGLAVECARRFYNQEGDFSAVTYNRLCLILDADRKGYQLKPYTPRTEGLPKTTNIPGVLLPSASILKNFIDKPMTWRVRLDHPPRQRLDYYFLRSSFNPNDVENRQNMEELTVYTPQKCSFDAALQVQLSVARDGTARPKFIYKSGRTGEELSAVSGKPFYLDMTYGQTAPTTKAYLGLDFGTSNTSISYIDEHAIQIYRKQSVENSWKELSDLASTLPYPLAEPLARYLSQGGLSKLVTQAREFIEAALAMAAYVTYLDYCVCKGRSETKLFKGFTQRSAGPLWDLLKKSLDQLGNSATISIPYKNLMAPEFYKPIDDAVTFVAQHKHGKVSETALDHLRPVQILANISQKVFTTNVFGFFEQVRKQKFSKEYQGLLRLACGCPPFVRVLKYQGPTAFSEDQPLLFNLEKGSALPLQPLVFWDRCGNHLDLDSGHCYLFDKPEKTEGHFSFKAVGYPCTCEVSNTNEYRALAEKLVEFREHDPKIELYDKIGTVQEVE